MGNKHGLPNSFQHPNLYIDHLDQYLTSEESRVLTKAIREILGWHNTIGSRTARIALSVFLRGKVNVKTGERVCGGVNLSRKAIITALDALHHYKILLKVGPKTHPQGQAYRLNINTDAIDWEGLRFRQQKTKTKNVQQTRCARQTRGIQDEQRHGASDVEQHKHGASNVEHHELTKASNVQHHEYSCCSTSLARQKASDVEQTERNKIKERKKEREQQEISPPLAVFFQFFPTIELNSIQQETIQATVQDLSKWSTACRHFALQNYRPDKVENLLDYYLHHTGNNGNGTGTESVEALTWFLALPEPERQTLEQDITTRFASVLASLSMEKRRTHQVYRRALSEIYQQRTRT